MILKKNLNNSIIHRCPVYFKKLREYEIIHIPPKSTLTFIRGVRDKFYMSHFKIKFEEFHILSKSRGR